MTGCLRGCLGRVTSLIVLSAAGFSAWLWGPELVDRLRGEVVPSEIGLEISPELAEAALDRFEAFRSGEGGDRLPLGGAELSSVIRYALPGILPPGVDRPQVRLEDGHIRLSASAAVDAFPDLRSLDEIVELLPDTVEIELRGTLTPFDDERLALHVDRIEASRIPIPGRLVSQILRALGRADVRDLPADALAVPLPAGLRTAYVLRDSLVLVADR